MLVEPTPFSLCRYGGKFVLLWQIYSLTANCLKREAAMFKSEPLLGNPTMRSDMVMNSTPSTDRSWS